MSFNKSVDLDALLKEDHQLAVELRNLYSEWKSYKRQAEQRWQETKEFVYATSTRETANAAVGGRDGMGWSHSTHIPKITQIYDNLVANYLFALFPGKDWFRFEGETREDVVKRKRLAAESYLKTKHRLNGFRNSIRALVEDWLLYGNCFAQVTYETVTEMIDNQEQTTYAGPVVNRISPNDIVFNPLAARFEDSPKMIRSLLTTGEFLRMAESTEGEGWDKEIIKKVREVRQAAYKGLGDDIDKEKQLMLDGFSSYSAYLKSGTIELLTFFGDIYDIENDELIKNHKILVVDRSWILEKAPINTWNGEAHIYHAGWRRRPDNLWAQGALDNLIGMQYQLNHLENSRADAFDQMILPTRVVVGDVDEDGVVPGQPGGTYRITGGEGSVSNLAPDTTVLNADFQMQFKMQLMEELAGAPREALGVRTPGEKTAFEVNSLVNAASRNFQSKLERFDTQFIEKILNAELALGRQYLSGTDLIRIEEEEGYKSFLDITKEDLTLTGKMVPVGSRHFAKQQQVAQNLIQLQTLIAQDPMVQQHFPSKKLAKLYEEVLGVEEFDLYNEYARITEQLEAQQLTQAASQVLAPEQPSPEEVTNEQEE